MGKTTAGKEGQSGVGVSSVNYRLAAAADLSAKIGKFALLDAIWGGFAGKFRARKTSLTSHVALGQRATQLLNFNLGNFGPAQIDERNVL
jgi:hypothetical protein